jgi:hypothetical protein
MQAYALCRYLREQGHELTIIDVRQKENASFGFIGKIIKSIIVGRRLKKDMRELYPPLTRRYYSVEDLQRDPPIADCYIVGSDQVWNPNISKELMFAYFLDFGGKDVKRVSYASSFGLSEWIVGDKEVNDHIKGLLCSYKGLSVREKEGQVLCERTFGCKPTIVLDPTFLNLDYNDIVGNCRPREEILCYKINKTEDFWTYAPVIGKIMGLPLALLNYNLPHKNFRYCFPPSLRIWMRRIAAASFVITDSFHGVAFSIINKKQFAVILNHNDRDSRLINVIRLFNLEERMFNTVEEMVNDRRWEKQINYMAVFKILYKERETSQQYLLDALKDIKQ